MSRLRVLYFGMEGVFSRAPLLALLDAGIEIAAVVVSRPTGLTISGIAPCRLVPPARRPRDLAMLNTPAEQSIIGLAWRHGIPVLEVASPRDGETLAAVRHLAPDLFCVACFPRLLPPVLLGLPRHGALNVHPSLLPAYRGPAPLFWVFHDGLEQAGITVHVLDEGADTGDIVAQAPLTLPDGISYEAAEQRCAEEGARLLLGAVRQMERGALPRRPQPFGPAPTAPAPTAADFEITPQWSARRAFNFIRGLAAWEQPIILESGDRQMRVREAVTFDATAVRRHFIECDGPYMRVLCCPGVLTVLPWER